MSFLNNLKNKFISSNNSRKISAVVASGIVGTAVMTVFSYKAYLFGIPKMKEINMLDILISKKAPSHILLATTIHFSVGIMFSTSYRALWSQGLGKPDPLNGLILGSICGVIGVAVWQAVIKTNAKLPQLTLAHLISTLMPAHILFGLSAVETYNRLKNIP